VILNHAERDAEQRRWGRQLLPSARCGPLWCRSGWTRRTRFPQVANKSLNFIVRLTGLDAFGRENRSPIVKVPAGVLRASSRCPDKLAPGQAGRSCC
jgi:polyphosphate kinase